MWLIPPFEGPDEAQHFAYLSWLINENSLPPQGDVAWSNGIEQESGQPPLYYFIASLPVRLVALNDPPAIYRPNPYFVGVLPPDNHNRAVHYPTDTTPLRGGWLALYVAREVTLLFGALLVIAVYGLAQQIWPNPRRIALAAALLVAVTPQVVFISSMVSNDVPAAAFSTLALWFFAYYAYHEESRPVLWGTAVGLAVGAAGLTKVSGFTVVIPIGLGLAWLWLTGRRSLGQVIAFGFALSTALLAIAGWWIVRNGWLYGSPLGLNPHDQTPWAMSAGAQVDPFILRWKDVWRSYWLSLGWSTMRWGGWPGGWPYTVLFGALAAAGGGWLWGMWRWWRTAVPRPSPITQAFLLLFVVGIIVNAITLENWMNRVVAPYGRLLFPTIGPITLLLIVGWHTLHPRLPLLMVSFVAFLALATPALLIQPTYTHTFLTPAQIASLPPSIGWYFGQTAAEPFAELISMEPHATSVDAGDILPIDVCWRALGTAVQDYPLLVQATGPENRLVSQRRTYPGAGNHPTSLWQAGQVWCDTIHMRIEATLAQTLVYRLEIAFFDEALNRRLPATDAAGNVLSQTFIRPVRLVQPAQQTFVPDLTAPPAIHLLDHQTEPVWAVGATTSLTLTWAAVATPAANYQIFIHLRDPQTGEAVFQADGPPLQGWYPTSWWAPYERITDPHTFVVPADLPPQSYRLVVGFYDLATGERPIPELDLGLVEVKPE